jgi:hypothetical protein
MVKVGRESLIPKGTDSALMRTIDVTETPAVAVVVQHRNGWHSYGQIIGDFKPSEFVRILRGDVALAMVAIRRDAYDALPAGDRARHEHKVEEQCIELQRRGNAVEKSYNQLLDRLRDDGQFSAKEFAAAAHTRARILKQWVMAVADLSALPEQKDSVLCEVVLNLYLLECDVNRRLTKDLVACTESDRLANSNAVETAQKLVRDRDKERKLEAQVVQETIAGAGRIHRGRSCSNRRKPGT